MILTFMIPESHFVHTCLPANITGDELTVNILDMHLKSRPVWKCFTAYLAYMRHSFYVCLGMVFDMIFFLADFWANFTFPGAFLLLYHYVYLIIKQTICFLVDIGLLNIHVNTIQKRIAIRKVFKVLIDIFTVQLLIL